MPILIRRPETAEDVALRFALFRDARHPLESLPGLDPVLAEPLLRHQFAGQEAGHRADHPAARREIVEVDGVAIGRLVVDEGAAAWRIVDVALLASWRGRGVGTRLLTEVIAEALGAGRALRLAVMAHNTGAIRLYRRLGFTVESAAPPALTMRWGGEPAPARSAACRSESGGAISDSIGSSGSGDV